MRPTPQARHVLSIAILAAVAGLYGYLAMLDDDLSDTQIDIASAALKRHDDALFAPDPVLGDSQLWRVHTPCFYGLLELVLFPTDYEDPSLAFRVMTPVLAMIFMCGMYGLLYRQCRSWSVAVFVAVLSTAFTTTLGRAWWGAGVLAAVTPTGICIALTPLVVLAFIHYAGAAGESGGHQWRLLLVFACVGLMGNIHLVAAMNLALVLLIAYLGKMRFRPSALPVAVGCGAAAVIGAFPYITYFLTLRARLVPADAQVSQKAIDEALRLGHLAGLYPELARSLLSWLVFVGSMCIVASLALVKVERFKVRDLSAWIWLIVGGFFISIGLHSLTFITGSLRQAGPPAVAFLQASAYVMLPLYVLVAQALTNLFRLVSTHRLLLRWACVAAMAAWLIPSDNLRILRHMGYDAATMFMAEKPLRVQQLNTRKAAHAEFDNIAQWARGTDKKSLFATNRNEFRMQGRRSMVVYEDDVRYYYYLAPWGLGGFLDRLKRQAALFQRPTDISELVQLRRDLSARGGFAEATEWYAILPAKLAPLDGGSFEINEAGKWGKHYRLFRIPPSLPTSGEQQPSSRPAAPARPGP